MLYQKGALCPRSSNRKINYWYKSSKQWQKTSTPLNKHNQNPRDRGDFLHSQAPNPHQLFCKNAKNSPTTTNFFAKMQKTLDFSAKICYYQSMNIIKRESYLKKLQALKGTNLIKVITGVRRCGKSTLLKIYRDELTASGISPKNIHFINFEDPKYSYDVSWKDIYDTLDAALVPNETNYIFLDEVQYIPDFERLLIGLQTKDNVDLYVTGSNAHMLSSELSTILSGRSIEISMLPLSFQEYLQAFPDSTLSKESLFDTYLSFGGFPQAVSIFEQDQDSITSYLTGIYETIVGRDILDRNEASDKSSINSIVRFLLDNIGNSTSVHNIATTLKISDRKADQIANALTASFLFYRLDRLDIKGKKLLKTQEKYYSVDSGLRWALLGRNANVDKGHLLENIIFLELIRRGNKISIGKVDDDEIDFVVLDTKGYTNYYQVTWSISSTSTKNREITPLTKIKDYNSRTIITMDPGAESLDGIKRLNAIDWLLSPESPATTRA